MTCIANSAVYGLVKALQAQVTGSPPRVNEVGKVPTWDGVEDNRGAALSAPACRFKGTGLVAPSPPSLTLGCPA